MKKGLNTKPKQLTGFFDNYKALITAAAFLLISFGATAQIHQPATLWGKEENRTVTLKAMQGPTGDGPPTSANITARKNFGIYLDSTNFRFYLYNPKTNTWDTLQRGSSAPAIYDATVDFSVNANPNTGGTTFNPNTPGLTTVVYVSTIDGSLWTYNGTVYVAYIQAAWGLLGNAVSSSHFIGTTNAQNLRIRVNNIPSGLVDITNENTGFGQNTLGALTTGNVNNAFGRYAGSSITTAGSNNAFGYEALRYTTSGGGNSAFGDRALVVNTTGTYNAALGSFSLSSNTTGSYNSAFGTNSLRFNTTGTGNIGFGRSVLTFNTTGNNNVGIGYFAGGYNTTASNQFFLNNLATANYSEDTIKSLAYGIFDANPLLQRFKINGRLEVRDGTQANGYVFTSDANGNGSWAPNAASGQRFAVSGEDATSGQNRTFITSGYQFQMYGTNGSKQQLFRFTPDSTMGIFLRDNTSADLAYMYINGSDSSMNLKGGRAVHGSGMALLDSGIIFKPNAGVVNFDSLRSTSSMTRKNVMVWDSVGGGTYQIPVSLLVGSVGAVTGLAAIGSAPNANGATISGGTLNLEPASASFGGVITTGAQTFAGAKTFNSQINITQGTITSATTPLNIASTWNNSGTTFSGGIINVTNTASAAASRLFQLQLSGADMFSFQSTGSTSQTINGFNGSSYLRFGNDVILANGASGRNVNLNSSAGGAIGIVGNGWLQWVPSESSSSGAGTLGLSKIATGRLAIGSGAANDSSGTITSANAVHMTSLGIGTSTPTAGTRLDIKGAGTTSGYGIQVKNSSGTNLFTVQDNGVLVANSNNSTFASSAFTGINLTSGQALGNAYMVVNNNGSGAAFRMFENGSIGAKALFGGTTMDASATVEIQHTSKGLLIPRTTRTNITAVSSPATGLLMYDNVMNKMLHYNSTAWTPLLDSTIAAATFAPIAGATQWTTTGGDIYRNTGFVGIGTTTPAKLLQVGTIDPVISLKQATSAQEYSIRIGTGAGLSSQTWNLYDNTVSKYLISGSGNRVSIGNPTNAYGSSTLYVKGYGSAGSNIDAQPDSTVADEGNIEIMKSDYTLGEGIAMRGWGNVGIAGGSNILGWAKKNLGLLDFTNQYNVIRTSNNTSLWFGTNNIKRAVLDSNGRFGIGTTLPTSNFQVEGSHNVSITVPSDGDYAVTGTDYIVSLKNWTTDHNITLPTGVTGRVLRFVPARADASAITFSQTIYDQAGTGITVIAFDIYGTIEIIWDGSRWQMIMSTLPG